MATNQFVLQKGAWTDLGAAPMFLQNRTDRPIYWLVAASAPVVPGGTDIADMAQHRLGGEDGARDVAVNFSGQRVYARGDGAAITVSN